MALFVSAHPATRSRFALPGQLLVPAHDRRCIMSSICRSSVPGDHAAVRDLRRQRQGILPHLPGKFHRVARRLFARPSCGTGRFPHAARAVAVSPSSDTLCRAPEATSSLDRLTSISAIAAITSAISRCCCMAISRRTLGLAQVQRTAQRRRPDTAAPSARPACAEARFPSSMPPILYTAKLWSPMVSRTSRDQIHGEVAVAGL